MDSKIVTMYRVKKYLKIFSASLFFFLIALFIFEYIRVKPKDVYFTNTTSSSVTVSWTTNSPIKGLAYVVNSNAFSPISLFGLNKEKYYDTRDIRKAELLAIQKTSEKLGESDDTTVSMEKFVTEVSITDMGKYYTHHIELKNLEPETEYQVLVGDGVLFTKVADVNGNIAKTASIPDSMPLPSPAYGSIRDADNRDIPVEELLAVDDAIVYFNYIDEESGNKSNITSSSMNADGNWYVDVANLIDSGGDKFLEKYDAFLAEINAEIVVNAGPKGIWKTKAPINEITPVPVIVLNIPNIVEDDEVPGSLIRIDSLSTNIVKSVEAAVADGCQFYKYCGPCYLFENNVNKGECDCPSTTLIARGCTGEYAAPEEKSVIEEKTQENLTCSGGASLGDVQPLNRECYMCEKRLSNGYYIAAWEKTTSFQYDSNTLTCKSAAETVSAPTPSKDGIKDEMIMDNATAPRKCDDADGCVCLYGVVNNNASNRVDIGYLEHCTVLSPAPKPETDPIAIPETVKDEPSKLCTTCHNSVPVTTYYSPPGCISCNEEEEVPSSTVKDSVMWAMAQNMKSLFPGEECNEKYPSFCLCFTNKNTGEPTTMRVKEGDVCPEVPVTRSPEPTPVPVPTPPSPDSLLQEFRKLLKTHAQGNVLNYDEYVIDPLNSSISILAPGEYIFENEGNLYFVKIDLANIEANNGNVPIFIDSNGSGEFEEDQDTKISELGSILKVATVNQTYVYNLEEGYNFISIPFLPILTEQRTAAGFIKSLNEINDDSIFSISRYDGSWKVVGQNTQVYDNNDFQLIPGQGYIIKAKRDVVITVLGQPIIYENPGDKAPVLLAKGWNLIGLYGSNIKQYTANSLIQDINSYNVVNFTSDNVTRWESDVQRYEGYQLTNENGIDMEYGFDYPIRLLQSYFIRVQDGSGNWQPGLK